jgi:hypothetical protein
MVAWRELHRFKRSTKKQKLLILILKQYGHMEEYYHPTRGSNVQKPNQLHLDRHGDKEINHTNSILLSYQPSLKE